MGPSRPSSYPDWALINQQDPISQQYNVVEPPQEKKNSGYVLQENPNRQYLNWLFRNIGDWIKYFDGGEINETGTFVPAILGGANITYAAVYGYYKRIEDFCFITMEIYFSGNTDNVSQKFISNLPFPAKVGNDGGNAFNQNLSITYISGTTQANNRNIKALISSGSSTIQIYETDLNTEVGQQTVNIGSSGQIIISGSYLIEDTRP